MSFRAFLVLRIGNGQFSPRASSSRSNLISVSAFIALDLHNDNGNSRSFLHDRKPPPTPAAESAGEVVNPLPPIVRDEFARLRGTRSGLAIHHDRTVLPDLPQSRRQHMQRNVHCSRNHPTLNFPIGPPTSIHTTQPPPHSLPPPSS